VKSLKLYRIEQSYTDPVKWPRACRRIRKTSPRLESGHVASGGSPLMLQKRSEGGFMRIRPFDVRGALWVNR
jgi:hypothetical protein